MTLQDRPLADRLEVGAPWLATLGARAGGALPEPLRRRILQAAFDRARDAFNRGDLEVVFALFADDAEYAPPPPLAGGPPLRGRGAVLEFWRDVFDRYDNTIENLSLEETSRGRFVRRARLQHRPHDMSETLDYVIVQTTDLEAGRVVRQVNALDPATRQTARFRSQPRDTPPAWVSVQECTLGPRSCSSSEAGAALSVLSARSGGTVVLLSAS